MALGGVFEVPASGRRYSDLDQFDEVRALCLAAVDGRYRETVWMIGDEVVRARGVVTIGSAQVPALWAHLRWNLLKRPQPPRVRLRRYEADRCGGLTPCRPDRAAVHAPESKPFAATVDTTGTNSSRPRDRHVRKSSIA